jgi:hypothetical protein
MTSRRHWGPALLCAALAAVSVFLALRGLA